MKTKILYLLSFAAFFVLPLAKGYGQTNNPPETTIKVNLDIKRPADSLGIAEVDLYITRCYDFYDQTIKLYKQLSAIEQQTLINDVTDIDMQLLENQVKSCKIQLTNLKGAGYDLVESGAQMTDKVTGKLKNKPFKIPGAIFKVKDATKALKASVQYIYTMLTVTVVNIEHRLSLKGVSVTASVTNLSGSSDSAGNSSYGDVNARSSNNGNAVGKRSTNGKTSSKNLNKNSVVTESKSGNTAAENKNNSIAAEKARTGVTMETSISITGIGYSGFNAFSIGLRKILSIKSFNKKFNSSGASEITVIHYGTTDDLLDAMLANCKDVFSEKNIGKSESGKISLVY